MADNEVMPLHNAVYSQQSSDFKSANQEMIKAIDTVSRYTGQKGIWTIDRAGDNELFFRKFIDEGKRFVIRLRKSRNILYKDKKLEISKLAKITYYREGKQKTK